MLNSAFGLNGIYFISLQLFYINKTEQAGKCTQCNTFGMFTQLQSLIQERLHFVIYTAGKEDQILR